MKTVVITQPRLTRYREPLFDALRERCRSMNIDLHLVHGQTGPADRSKNDEGHLPWAHRVENRLFTVGGRELIWQPLPPLLAGADLLIITQENRILSNYPLLLSRLSSPRKIAWFGHGANFQAARPDGSRERWKRFLLTRVDAWFAYTERTRDILLASGYPEQRITVVNNAIDTAGFRADLDAVTPARLNALRERVGSDGTAPLGLFCGSLYPDKRLDFLVAAAERIRILLPAFKLVVIGDGPDRDYLLELIVDKPWIHATGALYGSDKAAWFRLASVMLNPGLVGLNVLDAFCAGLPLVITCDTRHGPEIAYLENGINGSIVSGGIPEYAAVVVDLLKDPASYDAMCRNALASASRYTLDNMVQQFCNGIERCLATPGKR
jgi:glycosyltransferase involved in cell wall biosynthesis